MSLFGKASMINNNPNNSKKSILLANGIDIFIVIILLFLFLGPLIANLYFKLESGSNQVNLYLSPRCEELFEKGLIEKLLREFEDQNPDIRIRLASSASEESLDILVFDEGDFSALVAADALMELSSFTNYDSGTLQLAIPLVSFMDLLFYNIDILSAAGFDRPPKTRDEFLAYSRAISRGDFNASGAAISLSSNDRQALSRDIFSWIWAGGSDFWAEEENASFNTRPIINDITFLGILNREGLFAPDIFETTGSQRLEQFAQGKIAMMIASTRAIPYLIEKMEEGAFGITTIPGSNTGGKYNIGLSAVYVGMNPHTEYPDETWKFLEFLAKKSSLFCEELKAIPGVVSNIIPGDYVKDDTYYSKAWDIFETTFITEGFAGKPGVMEYKAAALEELKTFFETNRTAQQTVTAIQQRWDEVWEILEQ